MIVLLKHFRNIKLCCSIGSFSDANTLIRKLRDDLIQYAYILSIINLRKAFIEDDLKNLKVDNPEEFADSFSNINPIIFLQMLRKRFLLGSVRKFLI